MAWRWFLGGAAAILVGLTLWWTAFILVPAGIVLIAIGGVKLVRHSRPAAVPPESN